MATNEAIRTLVELIEINEEAAMGFQAASDGVAQQEFRTLFRLYAAQRREFAVTLKNQVKRLGGDMESETVRSMIDHARAKLHHARIGVRAALSGGSRHAMLVEAERGEDDAVKHYEAALRAGLPAEAQRIVRDQYEGIREAHRNIREMRDTMRKE